MDDLKLENEFWDVALKEAAPLDFTPGCAKQIQAVIKMGIAFLAHDDPATAKRHLSDARMNLHKLIMSMKEHAKTNHLSEDDLAEAKEKLCPMWPCSRESFNGARG